MKTKCCRDTPRCGSCPVRLVAAARAQRQASELGALFGDVFGGRTTQALPTCVASALDELEAARRFGRSSLAEAQALAG